MWSEINRKFDFPFVFSVQKQNCVSLIETEFRVQKQIKDGSTCNVSVGNIKFSLLKLSVRIPLNNLLQSKFRIKPKAGKNYNTIV